MAIAYRAGAFSRQQNPAVPSITIVVPAGVVAGDLMRLSYIAKSATGDPGGQAVISNPSGGSAGGWAAFGAQQATSGAVAKAWYKIAAVADAGATITCSYTGDTNTVEQDAILNAWSGADTTNPVPVLAQSVNSTSSATQVMPSIDTTGHDQCWIGSLYMGRGGTVTPATWSASAGWTIRQSSAPGGASHLTVASIDNNAPVAAGTGQGGGVLTADQAIAQNFLYTWAIAPASTGATARPNADVTSTGWTPSQAVPSGTPMCSLVADQNDATWVQSQAAPSAQVWEAHLPTLGAVPNSVTNKVFFGGGAVSGTVVTALIQGTTVIASRTDTYASSPPAAPTALTLSLTGAQQAAITNLADLRIRCTITAA